MRLRGMCVCCVMLAWLLVLALACLLTFNSRSVHRAFELFNLDIPDAQIDALMKECDDSGDGKVDYTEFVDALARDTVAPAAMGKHGMQSKEAMGVDAMAHVEKIKVKNFKVGEA